jgi:hypothetical protein
MNYAPASLFAKSILMPGSRVRLTTCVDLRPHAVIPAGSLGTIVLVSSAFVEILLDVYHKGLAEYDNVMWLCPAYDNVKEIVERLAA